MECLYEHWISPDVSLEKKRKMEGHVTRTSKRDIVTASRLLRKDFHEMRVLDYGMGWGFWAIAALGMGCQVTGIELSEKRLLYGKTKGIKVLGSLSGIDSISCDYIYANQVFEHIPEPRTVLREMARILDVGGLIQIQVPDGRRIEKALRRTDWMAKKDELHPLEHINCFSRRSFVELANAAGLMIGIPYQFPFLLRIRRAIIDGLGGSVSKVYLWKRVNTS
jgi:2-polyprenyl-3-methyl-5-hydroxy-6-metoxy-1,4-benzoquinol methylase